MPLSRLLLPLCGLLLALAVTAATAEAPLYGTGEVKVSVVATSTSTARDAQIMYCSSLAGALAPMVTDAVYTLVTNAMNSAKVTSSFSYMGASTMLSPAGCTEAQDSLVCVWYWDQGRYTGAENAVAFYKGNRDPRFLPGATMIGTSVSNYWRVFSASERCPCGYRGRYGAVLRDYSADPYWADATSTTYKYTSLSASRYYSTCAIEPMTTTTALPVNTTTEEDSGVNLPLVIGLSVGGAVALIVIITLVVSLVCWSGCCGCGEAHAMSAWARRESTSRANSMYSRHGDMGDFATRSFRDGALSKNGSIRYASVRGFNEDMEMATMVNALYARSMSMANMVAAAPTMVMAPQVMYNAWEAPQPVDVYAAEPPLDRHPSQGNLAE